MPTLGIFGADLKRGGGRGHLNRQPDMKDTGGPMAGSPGIRHSKHSPWDKAQP
jgi:hypothetical protein